MSNPMTIARRGVMAATALLLLTFLPPAAPASADPVSDPCQLAFSLFCRFVPILPELEHSVDLTLDQPPADPAVPLPESLPPPSPCAAGCV